MFSAIAVVWAVSWIAFIGISAFMKTKVGVTIAFAISWIIFGGGIWYVRERRRKLNSPGPSS
jgi:hypothetical protein